MLTIGKVAAQTDLIPIGAGAWAAGWLEDLGLLARYQRGFDIAGGVVLVLAGVYMLNVYYLLVPELAGF